MTLININEILQYLGLSLNDRSGGFYIENEEKILNTNGNYITIGLNNITFLDSEKFIKSFKKTEKKYRIIFFN